MGKVAKNGTYYERNKDYYRKYSQDPVNKARAKKWRKDNQERIKKWREEYLRKNRKRILAKRKEAFKKSHAIAPSNLSRYGMTKAEYLAIYSLQKGLCCICDRPQAKPWRWLCVEHNHKTGMFRGLVCMRCNTALGWFEALKDRILNHIQPMSKSCGETVK